MILQIVPCRLRQTVCSVAAPRNPTRSYPKPRVEESLLPGTQLQPSGLGSSLRGLGTWCPCGRWGPAGLVVDEDDLVHPGHSHNQQTPRGMGAGMTRDCKCKLEWISSSVSNLLTWPIRP